MLPETRSLELGGSGGGEGDGWGEEGSGGYSTSLRDIFCPREIKRKFLRIDYYHIDVDLNGIIQYILI